MSKGTSLNIIFHAILQIFWGLTRTVNIQLTLNGQLTLILSSLSQSHIYNTTHLITL